ncbi:MAG: methyltransferase domain-containing protein [Acidimicrobiia bacterium]|nr:methyltransferase domain-containing protein [Acidimicrobiia bacterium]
MERPDYILTNRAHWDVQADDYEDYATNLWAGEPVWGVFSVPEADVGLLPVDLEGKLVLEDGCGTGYVSAWMARRGAHPIGLDNSPRQLASASRFQQEHDLVFPLIHGIAETLPFRDKVFDVVVSEYGAAIWSDPYLWIPEAARVLKPGGELIFLGNSVLLMLCMPELDDGTPVDPTLKRDQRGMRRFEWPDDDSVEFHISHGDRIRLLRECGMEVEDMIDVYAHEGATSSYGWADQNWARQWPVEEVWKARKSS